MADPWGRAGLCTGTGLTGSTGRGAQGIRCPAATQREQHSGHGDGGAPLRSQVGGMKQLQGGILVPRHVKCLFSL